MIRAKEEKVNYRAVMQFHFKVAMPMYSHCNINFIRKVSLVRDREWLALLNLQKNLINFIKGTVNWSNL